MSSENFAKLYKNTNKPEDLRRRRTETSVELRKQRGNDEMMKRRNLNVDMDDDYTSGSDSELQQQQENAKPELEALSLEEAMAILQNNPTLEQVRHAFESVRRTLSRSKDPPIDQTIQLGYPFALVQALQYPDEKVQFEAAWSLTNIVSGTSAQTWACIQAGAIAPLLKLCVSPSLKMAEQAIWAVANIAGDGVKLRDMLFAEGIVPLIKELVTRLHKPGKSFVRTFTWAISNLCRHKKPPTPYEVLAELTPVIAQLIKYDDLQTRTDACWALSYVTDGPDENIELARAQNVVPDMVGFVESGQDQLIAPALRVLGNFATGNDELTQVVIDSGVLTQAVPQLLLTNNSSFVKECCWLISNVLAGSQSQIQDVIDAKLLPQLFTILEQGEHRCQYEAGWAVANLTHGGTPNQILEIFRLPNGIEAICSNLVSSKSMELVGNMLNALYGVLFTVSTHRPEKLQEVKDRVEECGALDKLESLQQHESNKIYEEAYKIIDEFFGDDEDEGVLDDMGGAQPMAAEGLGKVDFQF